MYEPTLADVRRFWSKVDTSGECWVWMPPPDDSGYGVFSMCRDGISRNYKAHRVAWVMCVGALPEDALVLHHCDNPPCVRPSHLHLGDNALNVAEMHGRGRSRKVRGVQCAWARLTETDVREIRHSHPGETVSSLARRFGVRRFTIQSVLTRRTWAHLDPEETP